MRIFPVLWGVAVLQRAGAIRVETERINFECDSPLPALFRDLKLRATEAGMQIIPAALTYLAAKRIGSLQINIKRGGGDGSVQKFALDHDVDFVVVVPDNASSHADLLHALSNISFLSPDPPFPRRWLKFTELLGKAQNLATWWGGNAASGGASYGGKPGEATREQELRLQQIDSSKSMQIDRHQYFFVNATALSSRMVANRATYVQLSQEFPRLAARAVEVAAQKSRLLEKGTLIDFFVIRQSTLAANVEYQVSEQAKVMLCGTEFPAFEDEGHGVYAYLLEQFELGVSTLPKAYKEFKDREPCFWFPPHPDIYEDAEVARIEGIANIFSERTLELNRSGFRSFEDCIGSPVINEVLSRTPPFK